MNEISLFCIKIGAKNLLTWDMSGQMIEPDLPTRKRPNKERSKARDIFNNFRHNKGHKLATTDKKFSFIFEKTSTNRCTFKKNGFGAPVDSVYIDRQWCEGHLPTGHKLENMSIDITIEVPNA